MTGVNKEVRCPISKMESPDPLKSNSALLASSKTDFGRMEGPALKLWRIIGANVSQPVLVPSLL